VIREAEAIGIEDVLIKPISASILFDTAMHLLGAHRKEASRESPETGTHPGLSGAKILLVEDNELNQEVASEILASAGCTVIVAANGEEAIKKVREAAFDIVLMDVQMPVMDGIAATREIRSQSRFTYLPIIAMTANAMREDRDRCLSAGMNDYITKPIDPNAMFATLSRYYEGGEKTRQEEQPSPQEAAPVPEISGIDTEGGLKRVMGNGNLYIDLLRRYSEGQKKAAERIRESLAAGDRPLAERIAHTLKGVSGNIGAAEIQSLAGELEAAINTSKPEGLINGLLDTLSGLLPATIGRIEQAVAETRKIGRASCRERVY
jgi:two-component system sensor histidine kinase/response regulator